MRCSLLEHNWFVSSLQTNWKVHISVSDLWLRSRLSWRQWWSQLQWVGLFLFLCFYRNKLNLLINCSLLLIYWLFRMITHLSHTSSSMAYC